MRIQNLYTRGFLIPFVVALLFMEHKKAMAVDGISNSKVIVPSVDTVPPRHLEVEPSFGLIGGKDSALRFSASNRVTFGVLKNLEVGVNIGYLDFEDSDQMDGKTGFGDIGTGVKFRFLENYGNVPFSLAYQGGVTFPTSNDSGWVFEVLGLVLTADFTEAFSMDADFVVSFIETENVGFVADIGFGYFIFPGFQPVFEAHYSLEKPYDGKGISAFGLTLGFTSPVNKVLTLIFGVSRDLYTRNAEKETSLLTAFTFFLTVP